MPLLKREYRILLQIIVSCLVSGIFVYAISCLVGEDIFESNRQLGQNEALIFQINTELKGGIAQRLARLGGVPEDSTSRKYYAVSLAKEIHDLSALTEKQRIIFNAYNVRNYEDQLQHLTDSADSADVDSLMDELDTVRREMRNAANLLDKHRKRLNRNRTAFMILFFLLWGGIYMNVDNRRILLGDQ
ncbi:MAG: hypothetical protein HKP58_08450 [Desulfatitalea sp.]|nr:hypothetical protein [Desulfatitalea sp.]NNK00431.1 hypothetical protein [Desulfatitalea sp.]